MVISSVIIKFNLTNEFNSDALMFKPICFTMQSDVYLSNIKINKYIIICIYKNCQNKVGNIPGAALKGEGGGCWVVSVKMSSLE